MKVPVVYILIEETSLFSKDETMALPVRIIDVFLNKDTAVTTMERLKSKQTNDKIYYAIETKILWRF